jgi:hypothetical protein
MQKHQRQQQQQAEPSSSTATAGTAATATAAESDVDESSESGDESLEDESTSESGDEVPAGVTNGKPHVVSHHLCVTDASWISIASVTVRILCCLLYCLMRNQSYCLILAVLLPIAFTINITPEHCLSICQLKAGFMTLLPCCI